MRKQCQPHPQRPSVTTPVTLSRSSTSSCLLLLLMLLTSTRHTVQAWSVFSVLARAPSLAIRKSISSPISSTTNYGYGSRSSRGNINDSSSSVTSTFSRSVSRNLGQLVSSSSSSSLFAFNNIYGPKKRQDNAAANSSNGSSATTKNGKDLSMRLPLLDNWKLLTNGRVAGTVRYHPEIPDGEQITTSPLANPNLVGRRKLVETFSGSKYVLGEPAMGTKQNKQYSVQELQRRARLEYGLTGDVIGDDSRQYLLAGRPIKSTSGKSKLYKAYSADSDGLPTGQPLLVKLSSNWEAIEREAQNYDRITKAGVTRGKFVELFDYLPTASVITKKLSSQSALVMERGAVDLKRYVAENGKLTGKQLRSAAAAAAQCVQAVHNCGLVWTDMKTENFVITKEGKVRGIDLESAMPVNDNPVDYSPEATPPEFARAFLQGDGPYFILQTNYDMWSLGMLLYELATGKGYFDGKTPMQITKLLRSGEEIDLKALEDNGVDPNLRDLIRRCLQLDPRKRPGIVQVLLHPYFLTTGIGPISF